MSTYNQRWLSKPPRGTLIDRSHPWTQGLQNFYALNEGTGGIAFDATGRFPLPAVGFGATNPWGVTKYSGVKANTAGCYFGALVPPSEQLTWPVTLACAFRVIGSTYPSTTLIGVMYNSAFATPYYDYGIYLTNSGVQLRWASGAAAAYEGVASNNYSVGVDYVVTATITATSQAIYLNGRLLGSGSSAIASPAFTATSMLGLGSLYQATNPTTQFYWGGIWNSAQSVAFHTSVGAGGVNAIWQMFRPMNSAAIYAGPRSLLFRRSLYGRAGSRGLFA